MKIAIACALVLASAGMAHAQLYGSKLYGTGSNPNTVYVPPSISSTGSMTSGHYRTAPNNTQLDNFGTRGNLNPYTGTTGTRWGRY
jgi:hypothetical protein